MPKKAKKLPKFRMKYDFEDVSFDLGTMGEYVVNRIEWAKEWYDSATKDGDLEGITESSKLRQDFINQINDWASRALYQRHLGRESGKKNKPTDTKKRLVVNLLAEYEKQGIPSRDISAKVAKRAGCSAQYVRLVRMELKDKTNEA